MAVKNQAFLHRLGYAARGLASAFKGEASFRFQCLAATAVLAVLIWRRPAPVWWALLLVCCGLVLAAELGNTALERALDRLHPDRHPAIGAAKDCAAAAVLVLAATAVVVFLAFLAATWP